MLSLKSLALEWDISNKSNKYYTRFSELIYDSIKLINFKYWKISCKKITKLNYE